MTLAHLLRPLLWRIAAAGAICSEVTPFGGRYGDPTPPVFGGAWGRLVGAVRGGVTDLPGCTTEGNVQRRFE